jgi:SOS-response transcriptional repressor LexA
MGSSALPATPWQLDVLRWMYDLAQDKGYPPTHKELGAWLGSRAGNATEYYFQVLERKGYIERRSERTNRGFAFTARAREACEKLPVLRESRCKVCNTATFAPYLPCPECKRQRAA